ncbi:MAG: hypothetical protein ACE5JD_12670 [Candidatus Methylomirabilia bacterium]
MAQVLIRGLEPATVEKLKARARKNNRSLQAELKHILEQAAGGSNADLRAAMKRVRAMFVRRTFSDSAELIREDRNR